MAGASKSDYQKGAEARRRAEGGTSSVAAEKGADDKAADAVAREKYDPAMRGERLSQADVQAAGGLGALARARGNKTGADAGSALAKRKKDGSY